MSLILCLFEMLKYILAEYLFFEKKGKKYWSFVAGYCIYVLFTFCTDISIDANHLIIYAVTLVASYCAMQGTFKKRISKLCILFFIMTALSGFVQFLYDLFLSAWFQQSIVGILILLKDIMSILFLGIGILLKKKSNDKFRWLSDICKDNSVFIMIFTAIIISFAISMLGYSKNMINNELYSIMAIVISGIAYLSIGLLGGMAIYLKMLNDKTKELMENEVLLKDMQKKYYEALLEQEKETRAYRHDMSNHLVCLSSLAEKGNIETLTNYLNEMRGEMLRIKGRHYKTGNEILDIMTNFYVPQLSDKIHVTLQSTADVKLDEMKICTIYANLLQNAVEELNSDPNREGKLNIVFKHKDHTFKMMVENSIFRKKEDNQRLVTQKKDKRNHGLGLANVTSVVETLGGKVFINNDSELFRILVELNI